MNDRPTNSSGHLEPSSADVDAATRRLMAALDALESAVERRREADRDEDELATRIQALGADRSRLADELDGSLVRTRKLERTNREISERLDAAIGTIRAVLGTVGAAATTAAVVTTGNAKDEKPTKLKAGDKPAKEDAEDEDSEEDGGEDDSD